MRCPDCDSVDRRQFLKTAALGTASAAVAAAVPKKLTGSSSETLVTTLYTSLTPEQKTKVVFPFDHPLRSKVDNNWHIVPQKLAEFFSKDQQEMIRQIFLGLHSPEYAEKVMQQVIHDSGAEGFGASSVALFGEPGSGKFEFVLTGRHCTRRCDGDSVEGAAFGGPIFYGHAADGFNEKPTHPGNAYWFQALRANEAFQMLNGKQRELALLDEPREEKGTATVQLTGKSAGLPGIPVSELLRDQKEHVRKVMDD